jgi:hypothetical protein
MAAVPPFRCGALARALRDRARARELHAAPGTAAARAPLRPPVCTPSTLAPSFRRLPPRAASDELAALVRAAASGAGGAGAAGDAAGGSGGGGGALQPLRAVKRCLRLVLPAAADWMSSFAFAAGGRSPARGRSRGPARRRAQPVPPPPRAAAAAVAAPAAAARAGCWARPRPACRLKFQRRAGRATCRRCCRRSSTRGWPAVERSATCSRAARCSPSCHRAPPARRRRGTRAEAAALAAALAAAGRAWRSNM